MAKARPKTYRKNRNRSNVVKNLKRLKEVNETIQKIKSEMNER